MNDTLPFRFELEAQPSETSCGPTCLQAVYNHYGYRRSVHELMTEIPELTTGGTLGVNLGIHAIEHGFRAQLYTYNLRVFDPTWFDQGKGVIIDRLRQRSQLPNSEKRRGAMLAYLRFLKLGGEVRLEVMNGELIRSLIATEGPILTGLSATFLYSAAREIPETDLPDDIKGEPVGHFVVLCGYLPEVGKVLVADPYLDNPLAEGKWYSVEVDRLVTAILLGVLTYDGNLLIIRPKTNNCAHGPDTDHR
jgi:hypothetical protein